jgi:Pilus assembly protein, PilO
MTVTLLALWVAAAGGRSFVDERHLLDRRLETLRRILPDGPNAPADVATTRELADQARLTRLELQARPPVESGASGNVILDLKATGRFGEIERFFRQMALSPRLIDVESVSLTDAPGTIQLSATVRLPYRPAGAPLTAVPEGVRGTIASVPKPQADAFVRDQALAFEKAQSIASLRRARRNPRLFLAELAAIVKERPVVLQQAKLGDEFLVRGLTVGEASVRALESRFERGFYRVNEFLMARQGACLRFEVRGQAPVVGPEAALPLPTDDPFTQDQTPCRLDRDQGRSLTVSAGTSKGTGPLTLRLRDVDLADVFYALHLVSGQGFVVDGDVVGRATVELSHVSLDEALVALQKQAELRVSGQAGMRRVSVARKTSPAPLALTGGTPPGTFALKRGEVRELLAVMSEADSGLAALGPPGFLGRASVWARGVALPDVRAALLASAGLNEHVEDGRRVLGRAEGGDDTRVPVAGSGGAGRLELGPHELAVLEFELSGVGASGEDWTAFAYSPTGRLIAYRAGARLADGLVKTIQSTDVLLESDEGPLRVSLAAVK